jgi:NADPH:quinone reductase-like Zn-dependent oxidoreductase
MAASGNMTAVLLTGHGGFEKLEIRQDVAIPQPGQGEVLIKVAAAGVNNTDINTRIGWYSKTVTGDINAGGTGGFDEINDDDASWSGEALKFPRIQGADCCGRIVAVGALVSESRIGERVLVRSIQISPDDDKGLKCITFGSECDGAFAQYTCALSSETLVVKSELSDIELAAVPCAYSTAEGMLDRASATAERILITGASGGVGSAAIQLAKLRGAEVFAICSSAKFSDVKAIGADQVIDRNDNIVQELGLESIDLVVDLVGGNSWSKLLDVLKRGGRYVVAGAIAGPLVELDVRTLYLKDLSFFGCTWQGKAVFENLIQYIESGQLKPVVARSYPLDQIVKAQQDFIDKKHTGKLVLVPPGE